MVKTEEQNERESAAVASEDRDMVQAGLNFGHVTSKTHPDMRPFIAGVRNTVHIFDLEKTKQKLDEALAALRDFTKEGKTVLLVGTKVQIRSLVKGAAESCGIPFVSYRWIGGTITNFPEIRKRVDHLNELRRQKEEGEWEDRYTKKERLDLDREIEDLEEKFGGIRSLNKLPDAVFICDLDENGLAAREAASTGIKVFGIADTNVDPGLCDHFIPANDDAISSVRYILEKVAEVWGGVLPKLSVAKEQKKPEEGGNPEESSKESKTDEENGGD